MNASAALGGDAGGEMMEPMEWFLVGVAALAGSLFTGARHTVLRVAARGYVKAARKTGEIVDPILKEWQQDVQEAVADEKRQMAQEGHASPEATGKHVRQGDRAIKGTGEAAKGAAKVASAAI